MSSAKEKAMHADDGNNGTNGNGIGNGNIEEKMKTFLSDLVAVDELAIAFNPFLVHRPDLESANKEIQLQEFHQVLSAAPQNNAKAVEQALK